MNNDQNLRPRANRKIVSALAGTLCVAGPIAGLYGGYRLYQAQYGKDGNRSLSQAVCGNSHDDLCKFVDNAIIRYPHHKVSQDPSNSNEFYLFCWSNRHFSADKSYNVHSADMIMKITKSGSKTHLRTIKVDPWYYTTNENGVIELESGKNESALFGFLNKNSVGYKEFSHADEFFITKELQQTGKGNGRLLEDKSEIHSKLFGKKAKKEMQNARDSLAKRQKNRKTHSKANKGFSR